jgi:uncharacterized damage-inducible protein DinB
MLMRLKTLATSMPAILALSVCAVSAQQPTTPSPTPTGLARVALGAKQRYDNIKRDIAESADAVPESEYSFKPTPQVRSFGELIGHVADVNAWYCGMANGENPNWSDKTEKTAKSKADLVKALKAATTKCDEVIAKTHADNALSLVPAGQRDQMRIMVILDNVAHLNEHYGNIVTYMRQKGHMPPSTLRDQRGSGQ